MKRCTYIYKAGDDAVVSGKCAIGDQCGSMYGSEERNGLCYGHWNQWRAEHDREGLEADKKKREATLAAHKQEAAEKHDNLITEVDKNPQKFGINDTIISAMGLNEPCDLENELALYKALNLGEGQENYDEKMAFARWLSTPETKRKPRDIAEAAKILGVSRQTVEIWRRSPDMARLKARNAEAILENAYNLVVYKVLEGADRLDPRYIKLYNEMRKDVVDKSPKSRFPQLPDGLVKQAEGRNKEEGRAQLHGAANDIEKAAVFSAVRDGNVEVEN
jgi:hypothetical protein